MVIYKHTKDNKPCETVFTHAGEAVKQALKDLETGHIYPLEIIQVIMDRNAIKEAAERLAA